MDLEANLGNIIGWIILGALAGLIAKAIMKEEGGFLKNLLLGIVGAFVGGWAFTLLGISDTTGFNIWSLFVSVIGAIIVIALVRLITGRRAA